MAENDRLTSYVGMVKQAGGVYIVRLPGNTNLGKSAEGKAGARFRDASARHGWRYDLAPQYVQQIVNGNVGDEYIAENHPIAVFKKVEAQVLDTLETVTTPIAEFTGLDHGLFGVLGKVLGIPQPLVILLVLFVGYAVLRQYKLVPSLTAVVK